MHPHETQLPVQEQRTSGLAIASLVLSLVCMGLPGVICGHIALSKIKRSADVLTGQGIAIAGLVIGYMGMLVAALFIIPTFFVGAQAYKKSADRAACVINQRNVQWEVRTYQSRLNLKPGDAIEWKKVIGAGSSIPTEPTCPAGGTYTFSPTIPVPGVQVMKCSHAGGTEKHAPKDVTGW